jgi:multiple sugar transport system permease protein
MTRTRTKNILVALAFLAPAAIYIVLFYGYPIVRNLTMSFQEFTAATFFTGEAPWVGMANYAAVLADPVFAQALRNTFIFTVASILGQFVIGMMLAIYFTKKFPLSSTLRSLLLLPWLIPMIVSSTIWRWILDKDSGVLNQFLSALSLVDTKPGWLTNTSLA